MTKEAQEMQKAPRSKLNGKPIKKLKFGIAAIALTDHNYIDRRNAVAQQRYDILRELAGLETKVKVLVGAELSAYGVGKFADDIACGVVILLVQSQCDF